MKDKLRQFVNKYKYALVGCAGTIVIIVIILVVVFAKNGDDNQNESIKNTSELRELSGNVTTILEVESSTAVYETTETTEETVDTTLEETTEETTTYVSETTLYTTVAQTYVAPTTVVTTTPQPTTIAQETTTATPLRGKDGVILEELTMTMREAGETEWIDYTMPVPKTYSEFKANAPSADTYYLAYEPPFLVSKNPIVKEIFFGESMPIDVKRIYGQPLVERKRSHNILSLVYRYGLYTDGNNEETMYLLFVFKDSTVLERIVIANGTQVFDE